MDDTTKFEELLSYMRRKLEEAERNGDAVCERFTLEDMRFLVRGLEELEVAAELPGTEVLRVTMLALPEAPKPLGPGWPVKFSDMARGFDIASRIGPIHYRDTKNSALAGFLVNAARVARDDLEVAALIGGGMR